MKTRTLVLFASVAIALAGCHHIVHVATAPVRATAHVVHHVVPHR
jgi:hypothetical protein